MQNLFAQSFDSIFLEIDNGQRVSDDLELAFTAGRFYLEALNFFHTDPEMAYLNLVNAGEVLVSKLTYSEEDLFDEDFRKFLNEIEGKMGKKAMEKVRSRLFQVRRKFRIGLSRLISQPFFDGHECKESGFAIIRENFESRMTAAYDLRSQFLHTGTRFGNWATILQQLNSEIGARPAYGSTEWKELIHRMPSLIGLERVIRFCLLRFIHQRVAPIHPKLE